MRVIFTLKPLIIDTIIYSEYIVWTPEGFHAFLLANYTNPGLIRTLLGRLEVQFDSGDFRPVIVESYATDMIDELRYFRFNVEYRGGEVIQLYLKQGYYNVKQVTSFLFPKQPVAFAPMCPLFLPDDGYYAGMPFKLRPPWEEGVAEGILYF